MLNWILLIIFTMYKTKAKSIVKAGTSNMACRRHGDHGHSVENPGLVDMYYRHFSVYVLN